MHDPKLGWAWFETTANSGNHDESPVDADLAHVFARCFGGEDGTKVLKHLKHITHARVLGPAASDALLRHTEGQRHLVSHILSLVAHGRSSGHFREGTSMGNGSAMTEITND